MVLMKFTSGRLGRWWRDRDGGRRRDGTRDDTGGWTFTVVTILVEFAAGRFSWGGVGWIRYDHALGRDHGPLVLDEQPIRGRR
jgi:hypothetical protein